MEKREREREFGWGGLRRREHDEKVRVLGRYLEKVKMTHHIRYVAHVAPCTFGHVAHSEPHIISVIS